MNNKNKLFKSLILLPLIVLFLGGCEKSILTDDPGGVDNRNVKIRVFHYWNNYLLNNDSIYSHNGARFYIDEINILLADFIFDNSGDSIFSEDSYTLTNYRSKEFKIGYLKQGSVSGRLYIKAGLSLDDNMTKPKDWEAGHILANESLYNSKANSYNFITIKGRIFDPTKPEQTEPSIPMSYVVATQGLVTQLSTAKSFSVPVGKSVVIDAIFDVKGLLENIFPVNTPVIKSDPADQGDYDNAVMLRANFEDSFKLQ